MGIKTNKLIDFLKLNSYFLRKGCSIKYQENTDYIIDKIKIMAG